MLCSASSTSPATAAEMEQQHQAQFDLETPPGSAKATDAIAATCFAQDATQQSSSDSIVVEENLATISLDTPSASNDDAAFKQDSSELGGSHSAGLPSAASSTAAAAAAAVSGLPLSSGLSSRNSSQGQVTESASAAAEAPAPAAAAAAAPAALHGISADVIADLPKASPVKVWVKDPEKVAERSRLGVSLASYVTCLVRTECSSTSCPLATPAAAAAAAEAPVKAGAVGEDAAAADGDSGQSKQQQQQQAVPHEGAAVFEVRRHFDDFDALSRLLKGHYRGYFIPRLPPSEWLTGGDLRTRKVDLQDYLSQVANHPVLQASEELRLFLTAAGDLAACATWQRMLQRPSPMDAVTADNHNHNTSSSSHNSSDPAGPGGSSSSSVGGAAAAAGGGGGGWAMVSRVRHSLGAAAKLMGPKTHRLELSADEQQLRQAKEWFKELQQHLSASCAVVRSLVGHLEALSESYGELGRAFSQFARFEEAMAARQGQYTTAGSTAVQRGADLQRLGYGALRQHSLSKQSVLSAGASLVFLPDYMALIPECVVALQEREDALDTVLFLAEQLRDKQEAAAKAAAAAATTVGSAAEADRRQAALAGTVHALQDKLLAAQQQYQVLKQRNQAELTRLNLRRAEDFNRALGRFAALQAQAAAAAADVWSGVAEQFAQQ